MKYYMLPLFSALFFMAESASAAQVDPQQIELIKNTAASICDVVNEAKGKKSDIQIKGDVKAQLSGLIGKVVDIGAGGAGTITQNEFEGLSQDATATALIGAQGCRERVFNKMFDKLTTIEDKLPKQKATVIEMPSSRFVHGERVAMATGNVAALYGTDVLMNAPPFQSGPNAAEFEVRATASGSYKFQARYASADSRHLNLTVNGHQITSNALSAPTGCFEQNCQIWMEQGEVFLQEGLNVIRLDTLGVFPHLTAIRFVLAQ